MIQKLKEKFLTIFRPITKGFKIIFVGFFIFIERKFLGLGQYREGPNKTLFKVLIIHKNASYRFMVMVELIRLPFDFYEGESELFIEIITPVEICITIIIIIDDPIFHHK
ncbi:unnamed protein product [Brugia timori]|uniref:NADH-ubiquinone oxidoreductase chain 1 n=1 Tax=Brugia timori TaxID=42155 RepID=A0A0R3R1I0_9BILA|nr:unnamed protein product [Brugia timori]